MFCEEFGAGIPTWAMGRKFENGKDLTQDEDGFRFGHGGKTIKMGCRCPVAILNDEKFTAGGVFVQKNRWIRDCCSAVSSHIARMTTIRRNGSWDRYNAG